MDTESKISWDPFSKGYLENPYPHINSCRRTNPVQKILPDTYMFFRYTDVKTILKGGNFRAFSLSKYLESKENYIFKNTENACPYLSKGTQLWPLYLNDGIHKKIRQSITKAFYAESIESIIQNSLEEVILEFANQPCINLVDFCSKFKFLFVKRILNIEEKEYSDVKRFSNLLAQFQGLYIPKKFYQELNAMMLEKKVDFFKSSSFRNSIINEIHDLGISDEGVYSIILASFMAAFEASKNNLLLSLIQILKNPQLIANILSFDNEAIKMFVEETVRFNSVAQYSVRTNKEAFDINDHHISKNSKLYLCLASANRDEEVFENPDKFIADRKVNQHLGFGAGPHQCLGARIARIEMNTCLQPMVNFLKDYTVDEIKWSKQVFMRTATSVLLKGKKVHV